MSNYILLDYGATVSLDFGIENKPELKKETLALKHWLYWHWKKVSNMKNNIQQKNKSSKKMSDLSFIISLHYHANISTCFSEPNQQTVNITKAKRNREFWVILWNLLM